MISEFRGTHEYMSNFYPSPVQGPGFLMYSTVEHAYQAAKSNVPEDWAEVQSCPTPGAAKKLGRRLAMVPGWDQVKIVVMWNLLVQKFSLDATDPTLAYNLESTGDQWLQEGNRWGDMFWGVNLDNSQGLNVLGQLLMMIRQQNRTRLTCARTS